MFLLVVLTPEGSEHKISYITCAAPKKVLASTRGKGIFTICAPYYLFQFYFPQIVTVFFH